MKTIEELQKELEQATARLDRERLEAAAKAAKEAEERRLVEEERVAQRAAQNKAAEERAEQRKKREAEAEQRRKRQETEDRRAEEQKQNVLEECLRQQKEMLEQLEREVVNAEHAEEQHRKMLEASTVQPTEEPAKSAEAAEGTDGRTPDSPLMSEHLRGVLRQANRTY